jgi:serine/threonine-protein kinase
MLGIGQQIGNYRIVRQLGAGGMGVVYEAEHPLLGKRVALKVIHRELAQNHEVVTRFFNEARAVNQAGHVHVVDVADFGQTTDGEYFLVMEMLVGRSLADVLERERMLPPARALHIAAQIADGLAAVHDAGIVHRDLKPDNVFLVERADDVDFVKIVDFGLAKLLQVGAAGGGITKQGVVLGTPEYMSPEQAESRPTVDARSDVWSLGILLYQMTTGLLPFVGGGMGEVLVKVVSRVAAPPSTVDPDLPPAIEQIILRCLQKRPEDRFADMRELRAALLDPDGWATSARTMTAVPAPLLPMAQTEPPRPEPGTASPGARTLIGTGVMPVVAPHLLQGGPSGVVAPAAQATAILSVEPVAGDVALARPWADAAVESDGPPLLPAGEARPANAPRAPRPRRSWRWPMIVTIVAGLAAGGLIAATCSRARSEGGGARADSVPGSADAPRPPPERPSSPAPSSPAPSFPAPSSPAPSSPAPSSPAPSSPAPSSPAPSSPAPSSPAPSSPAAPAPTAPSPAAPSPAAPGAPGAPVTPTTTTIRLAVSTDPTGARIFDDQTGELLGVSPTELILPRTDGERVLRFEHPGRGIKTKRVRTSADSALEVALETLRRVEPPPAAPAQPPRRAPKKPAARPDAKQDPITPRF